MRTTAAAAVALVAVIGVSTVVEAQSDSPTPAGEDEPGAPAPTITIVVPVGSPAGDEPLPAGIDDGPGAPTAATAAAATDEAGAAVAGAPSSTVADAATGTTVATAATTTVPVVSTPASSTAPEPSAQASAETTTTTLGPTANGSHVADQETTIHGTQVAVAVSGSNEITTQQPTSGAGSGGGADVAAGDADAIGSRDDNTVTQSADVVLTGDAVARILQIALILNLGAAMANSGLNAVAAAPTGDGATGQITTGDAGAIGNDIASYLTQGATAEASNALDDSASQLAISMFLGLATADSGTNSVSGAGVSGSGGGIGTGDAMAIGNDSLTDITQRAVAVAADGAEVDITQRATVLNVGFALANSGLNEISGVAGQLLAASDERHDALAQDLFAMLLPALLDSYGYGAGSGSVGSGDASAIGNRSETYVEQVARASATGQGTAVIDQEILVANVGAAGANTGGNVLGGTSRALDPQSASAVVSMAAFLAQLLSMVNTSPDAAAALADSSETLEVPFGDLILELEGSFDALDTTVSNGGTRADIRQISIVVSLGVAHANSGLNTTEVVSTTRVLAAVNSLLPELVATGDAMAANRSVVVICQRINAADVECLAPPEETPAPGGQLPDGGADGPAISPPPPTVTPLARPQESAAARGLRAPASASPQLPATGSDPRPLLLLAAAFVLVGAGLLRVRRTTAWPAEAADAPARF